MQSIFLVTAVAGATEFLRRLKVQDYWAAATILVATGIGAAAGALDAPGVGSVWDGIVIGLGSSGIVTIAQKFTSGTPSVK